MKDYGIWEPHAVKAQTVKTAIESACLLLRVDDIVSGINKRGQQQSVDSKLQENEEAMNEAADR